MNKTRRTILSLLLVIALLLPMAPAHAADKVPAKGCTLSASTTNVYYRSDYQGEVTVTATAVPENYNGTITWTVNNTALVAADKKSGKIELNQAYPYASESPKPKAIKLRAQKVSEMTSVIVSAILEGGITAQCAIIVIPDSVEMLVVTPATVSVEVGKTAKLTATTAYLSGEGTPKVTYASSAPAVATVDANGTVTGRSAGTATITAVAGDKSMTSLVTVTGPTTSTSGNAVLGQRYSMLDLYDSLLVQYNRSFSQNPGYITFTGLTNTYGTLKDSRGNVAANTTYAFRDLRDMYLEPTAAGSFTFRYTVTDVDNRNPLVGTSTIAITTPTTSIRVPIGGGSDYSFSAVSQDANGKSGAALIREAIGNFGSIKFGAVQSGNNIGTLYTAATAGYNDLVGNGTIVPATAIDALYFTPARTGAYSIAFEAWSGVNANGTLLCSGVLIIPVDSASMDLTISLDSVNPYVFSSALGTGSSSSSSAAAQLITALDNALGKMQWDGIRVTAATGAAAQVGALYQSAKSAAALTADTYITYSDIPSLYFVPTRMGVYETTYSVYTDSRTNVPLATAKLTINVSTVPSATADVSYTAQAGETITLNESDFLDFFQREFNVRYYLSSVTFDEVTGDGNFYHNGQRFVPRNSPECFTSTYTGQLPQSPHYLDKLTFTAPNASGFTSVRFTCSGGTTSNGVGSKASGVLQIYYTNGDVPTVSYNVYSSTTVDLQEKDFIAAYQDAMHTSAINPSFEIRLLNVPLNGSLRHYYSKTSARELTSSNISSYSSFWVNGADADSISRLTYVAPLYVTSGTDTVNYVALSSTGTMLYVGTIRFKLGPDRTATVYSEGLTFQASTFYTVGDRDPVVYVTFPQPESGRFYANTGSRYVAADDKTPFYTVSSADGTYPISAALYAPKANQTGTVNITCVAHRRSGASYEETINVTILSRSVSTEFTDVKDANTFIGASNSIDFAKSLGLVSGTAVNPPRFSPSNTMLRCHLILMLYRLDGSPAVTGTMPYTDVPSPVASNNYSVELYNSALWAYNSGVVSNVIFGSTYDTKAELTRQEFAQLLCNYTKLKTTNKIQQASLNAYSDAAKVSSNTYEGVSWAVANGYFTSASSGMTIEPDRKATRAEIATLLHRYLTY